MQQEHLLRVVRSLRRLVRKSVYRSVTVRRCRQKPFAARSVVMTKRLPDARLTVRRHLSASLYARKRIARRLKLARQRL